MTEDRPAKVVYLFGAGATQAELQSVDADLADKSGLLVSQLSTRVIEKARRNKRYLEDVATVSGTSGSLNIELLISLIENSKISGWEFKTSHLKKLVRKDIERVLSAPITRQFFLHKALFELHENPTARRKERLTGLISLNYDDVLDRAYREYHGPPRYCFSLDEPLLANDVPLLKLMDHLIGKIRRYGEGSEPSTSSLWDRPRATSIRPMAAFGTKHSRL